MELADIPRLVQELRGPERTDSAPRYPGTLAELAAEDFRRMGEKYLDDTRVYRKGKPHEVPFFIDKMPNNFRHLGLIHLILPNAKIIDARRELLACCFSNYKQLFASGQQFTYSIDDIARYYRMYVELMAHWDYALPGRILRIEHEDVVDRLFWQEQLERYAPVTPRFACSCSRHRTGRMLRTLGRAEVDSILAEQGVVSVTCDFCNAQYSFDAVDVGQLFFSGSTEPTRTDPPH